MIAQVLNNDQISNEYYRMKVSCPSVAETARLGNFVTLKISQLYEPLLRRPFTIYTHDPSEGTLDIIYKVVGAGTLFMSEMREGQKLDVIGPLGNGFNTSADERKIVLVAGGVGVTALYGLARMASSSIKDPEVTLIMGGATAQDIICIDDFKALGARILVTTEDGSMGETGRATNLLKKYLKDTPDKEELYLYACGPKGMLKETARLTAVYAIPCMVSMESRMGCGLGACLGCVIKVLPGAADLGSSLGPEYKRICRDGPVFDAAEIDWESI